MKQLTGKISILGNDYSNWTYASNIYGFYRLDTKDRKWDAVTGVILSLLWLLISSIPSLFPIVFYMRKGNGYNKE